MRPTRSPLYGWPAPLNVSAYGLLTALLAGSILALMLATGLHALIWGPPARPRLLVPLRQSRLFALAGITVLGILLIKPQWRKAAICGMALLSVWALGPVYSPVHFLRNLAAALKTGNTLHLASLVGSLGLSAALVGLGAQHLLRRARLTKGGVRGSTQWGRGEALLSASRGFVLGTVHGRMLRYNGSGHLMTIAATRSGKGVGAIIPNLLSHPGSLVVTDPKGENYFITQRYRQETLKQKVVALDPFGITKAPPMGFNPLDLINLKNNDYVENAMIMADMIIAPRGTAHEPHWIMEGRALLYAFILHVCTYDDAQRRNLIEVRRLLTLDPNDLMAELDTMLRSPVAQVKEGAGRILQKSGRERSGVFSTAQSYTHFLSSPRMQHVLTTTTFSLSTLIEDQLSLYLILPREHLTTFAPWMRLMISCCYYACTHNLLTRPRARERILFLLDEFANLGYMSNIKEAVSLGGGYGVTMWLILQDMAQLKREYHHEWESFLANSDVIQTFAIQDPFTAEHVTRLLGQTTVWQRRVRKSSRREGSRLIREYDEESRPLLRPEELRRLHPDRQLLMVRPYQPVVANKIRYYQDAPFAGRFDRNPYFSG